MREILFAHRHTILFALALLPMLLAVVHPPAQKTSGQAPSASSTVQSTQRMVVALIPR